MDSRLAEFERRAAADPDDLDAFRLFVRAAKVAGLDVVAPLLEEADEMAAAGCDLWDGYSMMDGRRTITDHIANHERRRRLDWLLKRLGAVGLLEATVVQPADSFGTQVRIHPPGIVPKGRNRSKCYLTIFKAGDLKSIGLRSRLGKHLRAMRERYGVICAELEVYESREWPSPREWVTEGRKLLKERRKREAIARHEAAQAEAHRQKVERVVRVQAILHAEEISQKCQEQTG